MKQTLHRLFCLLLCAVMVVGMIPATASAAQNDKAPAEYEETTVTAEEDGCLVTVGENGKRTYVPTTFEKERTVLVPVTGEENSFAAKKTITDNDWSSSFTTFEDLKELAKRTYSEWTYVYYAGDEALVISESLTLPKNMDLYIENEQDLVIPAGVTLTTTSDLQVYGDLTVEGTLILNSYARFEGDVTVTGTVKTQSDIHLEWGNDFTGLSNVQFSNSWAGFVYIFDTETFAELKEAVAVATANPANEYQIYLRPDEDIVISSNLTFPKNVYFYSWWSNTITVNAGVTLTFNCYAGISSPMVIKGKLVNNKRISYQGIDNDAAMQFTSTGSYSGNGYLHIYVNDDDIDYTPYVTGLDTTNMDIVEYQDEWEHYWQIRDITGLTRLGTPSSLAWNKAERYSYDDSTDQWVTNVETFYGAIRFKPSKIMEKNSEGVTWYRITLYKDGEFFYSITYGYSNDYLKQIEYIYEYPCYDKDFESGTYYFTVQAIADSADYMDGPVNTSKTWTYTKPTSRYARPTATEWHNGPNATWTNALEDYYPAKVEFFYAPTANDTPQSIYWAWHEDMIGFEIDEWVFNSWGPGYYYFKVRTLSQNITKKFHSAWTGMSKAYHYTGEEKPVTPSMEVFFDNYNGCPRLEIRRSPGANDYEIYRATSRTGTYKKIDTIQIYDLGYWHRYYDTTATVGKTYYYKVRAVSYTGVKSSFCSVGSCKVRLAMPQVSITNDASTGKPVVKWETVDGASKYYVYRATSKTGEFTKVYTGITARSYKDTSTKAGKVYYYYVVAVHEQSAYNSSPSVVVYTRCDLKRPVVSIQLTSGGNPYLKWSEISGAEKYFIYRATSKTGSYKRIGSTTTLKYVDKDVTAGKTYYYRVKAIHSNSAANSAYSATDYIKAK